MENLDKRRMVVLLFLKLITSDNPIKSVLAAADRFEKIFFLCAGVCEIYCCAVFLTPASIMLACSRDTSGSLSSDKSETNLISDQPDEYDNTW